MAGKKKTKPDLYCPDDCPHMETPALRDVNSLPFYCEKFDCFLGFNRGILRCDACSGCPRGIKETALSLIGAMRHPNISPLHTKQAFGHMTSEDQQRYVSLLLKHGPALGLTKPSVKSGDPTTWAQTLTQMLNVQEDVINHAPSPQAAVASFLGTTPDSFAGIMDRQVCQLLQNLLGILDNTERYWVREVLSNKEGMANFAKKLKDMPKGKSFVANVRRELEDAFKKEMARQKESERRRTRENLKVGERLKQVQRQLEL